MEKQRGLAKEKRKEKRRAREEARAKAGLGKKANAEVKVEVCASENSLPYNGSGSAYLLHSIGQTCIPS